MVNSKLLKGIRVSQGYTQKPVADALDLALSTYCQKENAKVEFTPTEIGQLAAFLNMDIYQVNEVFFGKKLSVGKSEQAASNELKQTA